MLSPGQRVCKCEDDVAPDVARRTPTIGRPGKSVHAGTDPAAAAVIGEMVGRGRHALL
jgi:hypothetical protein